MRLAALLLPAVLWSGVATAATPCADTCKTLVDEGTVLLTRGQAQQALDKYQAAIAAAPDAPYPRLAAAALLLDLSWHAPAPQAGKLHDMADALARQALRIDPANAMAQDVLRQIQDGPPVVLHQPTPAAQQALAQAETLYVQHRFDDARKQYESASALDPLWSTPVVGAGDCYFGQQDWAHAESLFRRATEIEPKNPQAWRYLADSLIKQGKTGPGEQALYGAIAANPADRNTWSKLASARAHAQLPLTALHLQRHGSVSWDANGKYTVHVDPQAQATPDGTFALALAMGEVTARNAAGGKARPALDIELAAWRSALQVADELAANGGQPLTDPALLRMQAMAKDGQLAPALLILAYRPVYRTQFDAWLAAHPDGVKAFIDRYGLQP